MPTMPYDRERQRMIREHQKKQEDDAGGKDKLPHEKWVVKGRAERAPVYQLALDDLAFNKANGRIKAETLEKEAELGRELEPSSREDQRIIKEILLSIRTDENAKIIEDLRKNGQLRPGIITCDGFIINGNRRKALLEKLYKETGNAKFKYLDVQILPSDISKAELWLIEAGIQMSAPKQLDYSPINHLLKLREGVESGLKIADIADGIYGVTKENIESDLNRLDIIDEYLSDFLKKPDRYYLVRHLNEHFIDLQDILNWARRPRGIRLNWKPDDSDINELKLVAFYYIRIKFPHLRIRELRDLFATQESWKQVKHALTLEVELSREERSGLGLEIVDEDKEEEDTDEDSSTYPPNASGMSMAAEEKDWQEEAHWTQKYKRSLHSFFEDAKEQKQIIKDTERPLALAKRALNNITAIPHDPKKLAEPDIDDVLRQIIVHVNVLRKILHKAPIRKQSNRVLIDSATRMTKRKRGARKGRG